VPAWLRLSAHFLAALWVFWIFHGMPPLRLGFTVWHWHHLGTLIGLIGFVWLINFYNFMDGIDGFAGMEAVFVSIGVLILLLIVGSFHLIWALVLLAAVVSGFLLWNLPPARLFMGDIGSGFLGYIFGVILIASVSERTLMPWPWLILLSCFWVDATITLIRRVLAGERWYQAHRTHAFQVAVDKLGGHRHVLLAATLINVFWLLPLSILSLDYSHFAVVVTVISMIPIMGLWWYLNRQRVKHAQST